MDTLSSIVLAIVFLLGASIGALVTTASRYAARNAIQRDFQGVLAAIVEEQELARTATSATASSETIRREPSQTPFEDVHDIDEVEDTTWIPARGHAAKPDALRL